MCYAPSNKWKDDDFGPFLGTVVKNTKSKKLRLVSIYIYVSKNLNVTIWVLRMRCANMYIFLAQNGSAAVDLFWAKKWEKKIKNFHLSRPNNTWPLVCCQPLLLQSNKK